MNKSFPKTNTHLLKKQWYHPQKMLRKAVLELWLLITSWNSMFMLVTYLKTLLPGKKTTIPIPYPPTPRKTQIQSKERKKETTTKKNSWKILGQWKTCPKDRDMLKKDKTEVLFYITISSENSLLCSFILLQFCNDLFFSEVSTVTVAEDLNKVAPIFSVRQRIRRNTITLYNSMENVNYNTFNRA